MLGTRSSPGHGNVRLTRNDHHSLLRLIHFQSSFNDAQVEKGEFVCESKFERVCVYGLVGVCVRE